MTTEELQTPCDCTEVTLAEAASRLGCDLHALKIYAPRTEQVSVRRLQAVFGFDLVIIPSAMLMGPFAWGAEHSGNLIWSRGA